MPSWTYLICCFKLSVNENIASQISHLNGFFLSWTCAIWRVKLCFSLKFKSQDCIWMAYIFHEQRIFYLFYFLYSRDAIITCVVNTLTCLLAGVLVFSILGYMAKIQETTIEDVVNSGKGLIIYLIVHLSNKYILIYIFIYWIL